MWTSLAICNSTFPQLFQTAPFNILSLRYVPILFWYGNISFQILFLKIIYSWAFSFFPLTFSLQLLISHNIFHDVHGLVEDMPT